MTKTNIRTVPSTTLGRPKVTEAMRNYREVGKKGQDVINERLEKNRQNWDAYFKDRNKS